MPKIRAGMTCHQVERDGLQALAGPAPNLEEPESQGAELEMRDVKTR